MLTTMLTLIAAVVAAYTAVLKTRHEKLWLERYEKTGAALLRANIIARYLQSEINGDHEVHGLTSHEKTSLNSSWPTARYELERDMVLLQLLFDSDDLVAIETSWHELQEKLFYLIEDSMPHDRPDYIIQALPKAQAMETSLIDLGRKKCVDPFYVSWIDAIKQYKN
ncbi:hypothetical protein [Pseudomonas mosselii]|uniref:hypothetical protein n=1 Tax=Pseudomonas mosselii TaxID=78327 RepID=UPI002161F5C1|nr:hypothetical protein [Pseudomonas mosselii]UVN46211.1 hypothetical protein NW905_09490 [Pseudomonas mosselii]